MVDVGIRTMYEMIHVSMKISNSNTCNPEDSNISAHLVDSVAHQLKP